MQLHVISKFRRTSCHEHLNFKVNPEQICVYELFIKLSKMCTFPKQIKRFQERKTRRVLVLLWRHGGTRTNLRRDDCYLQYQWRLGWCEIRKRETEKWNGEF